MGEQIFDLFLYSGQYLSNLAELAFDVLGEHSLKETAGCEMDQTFLLIRSNRPSLVLTLDKLDKLVKTCAGLGSGGGGAYWASAHKMVDTFGDTQVYLSLLNAYTVL